VLSCLGEGGSGIVYKAIQIDISRLVAVKSLYRVAWNNEQQYARFEREARILANLTHENIVSVYALVLEPETPPFLIMEFVEGKALNQVIIEQGPLPEARTLNIGIQICSALDCAHETGVVHRDLKPQNILLTDTPQADFVKILDFGLSRLTLSDPELEKLTRTGELLGTPQYMSPEQCKSDPVDARSDIYSIGCVLYECLSGKPPFTQEHPLALLHQHRFGWPERLNRQPQAPKVTPELELVVFKCLQKDPADRFQSAADLMEALTLIRDGHADRLVLGNVRLGRTAARKTRLSQVAVPVMLVLAAGLAFLVFNARPHLKSDEYFNKTHDAAKNKDLLLSGSPERRLVALCEFSGPARPESIKEIELLLPELKGQGQLLRLAGLRKGLWESELKMTGAARKSYLAALIAVPLKPGRDVEAEQLLAGLSQIALALGNQTEAERFASKVIELTDKSDTFDVELDTSTRALLFARLAADPRSKAYRTLATVALQRHDYRHAEQYARKAFQHLKAAEDIEAELLLADCLEKNGNHAEAVQELSGFLQRIAEGKPFSTETTVRRRFVGGTVPGVLSLADRAQIETPLINQFRTVGLWCLKNGERKLGLRYLQTALERSRNIDEESALSKSLAEDLRNAEQH
jgi:serine/threonine protein kinase